MRRAAADSRASQRSDANRPRIRRGSFGEDELPRALPRDAQSHRRAVRRSAARQPSAHAPAAVVRVAHKPSGVRATA